MTNYIEGFDPAGAALTELKKDMDKLLQRFEDEKAEVVSNLDSMKYWVSDMGTGAGYYLNPDRLTITSAKIRATGEAISILEYYIEKSTNK